jgi:hypothetical protein
VNSPGRFTEAEFEELVELYPKHYPYLERVRMAFRAVGRSCPDRLSSFDRGWLSESIQKWVKHLPAEEEFKAMGISLQSGKLAASDAGKLGQLSKKNRSEKKRRDRNRELDDEFLKWKNRTGNSRKGPEQFWNAIVDGRWLLRERLRRRLTPRGKFLSKRQFLTILHARPRNNRG